MIPVVCARKLQPKCPAVQAGTQTLFLPQRSSNSLFVQFEFSYFFETGTRRRCYLAPERFIDSGQAAPQPDALQPAMASTVHQVLFSRRDRPAVQGMT